MPFFIETLKNENVSLPNSREIILTSATECFFQHGYSTANISMIGRYAGISRVTIHKQFKSKEDLFRAVIEKYIAEKNEFLECYIHSKGDFWLETESFILERCDGLFEEVLSVIVRTDLLHAGQSYCQDIIHENELRVREAITLRITDELTENRMTLSEISMSKEEFARVIVSAPFGLAISSVEEDNRAFVKHLMKIFKASTAI